MVFPEVLAEQGRMTKMSKPATISSGYGERIRMFASILNSIIVKNTHGVVNITATDETRKSFVIKYKLPRQSKYYDRGHGIVRGEMFLFEYKKLK